MTTILALNSATRDISRYPDASDVTYRMDSGNTVGRSVEIVGFTTDTHSNDLVLDDDQFIYFSEDDEVGADSGTKPMCSFFRALVPRGIYNVANPIEAAVDFEHAFGHTQQVDTSHVLFTTVKPSMHIVMAQPSGQTADARRFTISAGNDATRRIKLRIHTSQVDFGVVRMEQVGTSVRYTTSVPHGMVRGAMLNLTSCASYLRVGMTPALGVSDKYAIVHNVSSPTTFDVLGDGLAAGVTAVPQSQIRVRQYSRDANFFEAYGNDFDTGTNFSVYNVSSVVNPTCTYEARWNDVQYDAARVRFSANPFGLGLFEYTELSPTHLQLVHAFTIVKDIAGANLTLEFVDTNGYNNHFQLAPVGSRDIVSATNALYVTLDTDQGPMNVVSLNHNGRDGAIATATAVMLNNMVTDMGMSWRIFTSPHECMQRQPLLRSIRVRLHDSDGQLVSGAIRNYTLVIKLL